MSDVREQLIQMIRESRQDMCRSEDITDAILERFEVTARPVVTETEMVGMVCQANGTSHHYGRLEHVGKRMLDQLDAAGLRLVRVEDGS